MPKIRNGALKLCFLVGLSETRTRECYQVADPTSNCSFRQLTVKIDGSYFYALGLDQLDTAAKQLYLATSLNL